jgi:hypothetical protein
MVLCNSTVVTLVFLTCLHSISLKYSHYRVRSDFVRGARGESVELAESVGRAAGVVAARPDAGACARGAATAAATAAAAGCGGEEPAGVGCIVECGEGRGACDGQ